MCEIPNYLSFSNTGLEIWANMWTVRFFGCLMECFSFFGTFPVGNNEVLRCFQWDLGVDGNLP